MRRAIAGFAAGVMLFMGSTAAGAESSNLIELKRPRFGKVVVGTTAREVVYVTNVGSTDVEILTVSMREVDPAFGFGDGRRGTCTPLSITLAPGETCGVVIVFRPQEPGLYQAKGLRAEFLVEGSSSSDSSREINFTAQAV